jgi:hypothetical protein
MVNVRPQTIDIDLENGQFYADIEWQDSFEVENCQTENLHSDQPVCWMLLGYAISYSSFSSAGRSSTRRSVAAVAATALPDHRQARRAVGRRRRDHAYFQSDPIIDELQALQVQVANMRQRLQIEPASSTASASRRCTAGPAH